MRTFEFLSFLVFILVLGVISCVDDILLEGNGDQRSEFRAASGFDQIASSGDFIVMVKPGDEYSVEVNAESNLLSFIETEVSGTTLKIRTRGIHSLVKNNPVEINITTPVLEALSLSGSGLIRTGRFLSDDFKVALSGSGDIEAEVKADHVKANVSGSGTILLKGEARESELVVSGSGKIKAYDLPHRNCDAVISGSGSMYVNASENITARIAGSGMVFHISDPVIHTSIYGSGGVVNKN
ncbi:MAG TPA: head GIN domain-containing protein [Prolixibacteraceae bacterium]|nr:head GIN domain-containing protein [Prolixibacteraceae bacterium]